MFHQHMFILKRCDLMGFNGFDQDEFPSSFKWNELQLISTWKAVCALFFKARVAGFKGVKLPKKKGHLAFQELIICSGLKCK